MDDLLAEFLTETRESISLLDGRLVMFEKNPSDKDALAEIFRVVHTIKGTCGFLDLRRLEKIAHAAESLLNTFNEAPESVTSERVSLVLEALDDIKSILDSLASKRKEPEEDNQDLLKRLDRETKIQTDANAMSKEQWDSDKQQQIENEVATQSSPPAVFTDNSNSISVPILGEENYEQDITTAWQGGMLASSNQNAIVSITSLRVRLDLIEQLMDSVSELVLSRNQLLQILRQNPSSEFSIPLQRLNQITTALQEGIMKTRMQPIQNAWNPLPRLVRDLAKSMGKQVRLEMVGADTELDRQIIEMIRDPLVHIVRNAIDHGLELPAERVRRGKDEQGTITMKAYQEGGQIMIEVYDDGKGVDHEKIRIKLIDQNFASEAEAARLSQSQLHRFLFQSGFSTADKITEVSGRGVGLDVVKNNIDKIGGQIEINSTLGTGSQIRIKIPLTLAIVSVLIVKVGGQRYAFPQTSVVELVSFRETQEHQVSVLQDKLVLQLREQLLPLISIRELFALTNFLQNTPKTPIPTMTSETSDNAIDTSNNTLPENNAEAASLGNIVAEALSPNYVSQKPPVIFKPSLSKGELGQQMLKGVMQSEDNYVVVLQVGAQQFGILVEDIQDTEEIVVKPLSAPLRGTPFFSGNTILGDGRVILIVDPNYLAEQVGQGLESAEIEVAQEQQQLHESSVTLVMLDSGDGVKKVVPVSAINRLEHIDCSRIEYPNARATVLYNETLMPIMRIEDARSLPAEGLRPVLILSDGEKWAGILVEEVLDIIEEPMRIEVSGSGENGIIGSAIIKEQSVEVLDMDFFWKKAFNKERALPIDLAGVESTNKKATRERRLLLVEKNRTFCDAIIPHLSSAGYRVFIANNIEQAVLYHKNSIPFDVLISDIDENSEQVLQFVSRTRKSHSAWANMPILAITANTPSEEITETCRIAGFTDFLSKINRTDIVQCLNSLPEQPNL